MQHWLVLLLFHVFKSQFDWETLPEAVPCFGFVRIVQLLSAQWQLPVRYEAGVEPEVEGTFLVVFGNISSAGLEQDLGVSPQDWTVDSLDGQQVWTLVVARLTVYLRERKVQENIWREVRRNFSESKSSLQGFDSESIQKIISDVVCSWKENFSHLL